MEGYRYIDWATIYKSTAKVGEVLVRVRNPFQPGGFVGAILDVMILEAEEIQYGLDYDATCGVAVQGYIDLVKHARRRIQPISFVREAITLQNEQAGLALVGDVARELQSSNNVQPYQYGIQRAVLRYERLHSLILPLLRTSQLETVPSSA